jgi:protocatechuate 3,4-dioxygenase beta subunit
MTDPIDYFSEGRSEEVVNARIGASADPRLGQIISSLVRHLHAFAKDVQLTQGEWAIAIDFLTRTGQMSDGNRQEFILLSDVLGLSMLVDALNHRRPSGATENTVLGPFHVAGAPHYPMGTNISLDGKGESCLFTGTVRDIDGQPIANATIDVWCDNAEGFYDVQQPGIQPQWNNRGIFVTGPDGQYSFRGIRPVSYPIPDDGPVGQMLSALGRHPNRPAHMHFIVSAPNHKTIVTHTFVQGDEWLTSDAVFGVKASLIATMEPGTDTAWHSSFDFVMTRSD